MKSFVNSRSHCLASLAAAGVLFGVLGCGAMEDLEGTSTVEVQPRVVLDGLIELGARTQGNVVIEEFVLHAGSVTAVNQLGDRLSVDEDPLLFRYDLASGGAQAETRLWNLHSGLSDVSVNVSPARDEDQLAALTAINDIDLNGLVGNAGLLRGFVLVERGSRELVAESSKESRLRASGDPDGLPARTSGDPDGLPAHGEQSSGDPDGLPAKKAKSSGDPDGLPAHASGDPDGLPADQFNPKKASGDPDGLPAQTSGDPDGLPARTHARRLMNAPDAQLIPFLVVFKEPMGLSVPIESLLGKGDAALDLHFDVSAFLNEELLSTLEESDEERMVIRGSSSLFTVEQAELSPNLDDDELDADDAPGALSNLSRRD